MSAQEQMRKMLDELMGTRRNGEDIREEKLHYSSVRVCKSFLLNCCPHEILKDTRGDMGQCKKVHDVALRADYENSSKKDELSFRREALMQLKNFIGESERRIQIAKVRLAETQEVLNNEERERMEKIKQIGIEINEMLSKAEVLGAAGDVEGSLKMMEAVDLLKKQKFQAEEEYRNATPASISQQQKLRVCEVCSSYLGVNDNDRRLADHFNGKLHLGFITIRDKLKELESPLSKTFFEALKEVYYKDYIIQLELLPFERDKPPAITQVDLVQDHHIHVELEKIFTKQVPEKPKSQSRSPEHSKEHHKSHSSRSRSHRKEHSHKSSKRERSRSSHHKHKHSSHHSRRKHSSERASKSTDNEKLAN